MSYIMVAVGLIVLVFCGDMLVKGAVALSIKLNVPRLLVGLTIVSIGTSAPELFVCIQAALNGHESMAVGNIVGSNIANVLLVLGLPAVFYSMTCCQPGVRRNAVAMMVVSVIFVILSWTGPLSTLHGIALILLLTAFLTYSARVGRQARAAVSAGTDIDMEDPLEEFDDGTLPGNNMSILILIVLGTAGLPLGAWLLVDGASDIARHWGVSDAVIGLTLVAIGTSLPELAATLAAAFRQQHAVAIGNVIGSNMFNILAVMGVTALVTPLPIPPEMLAVDLWVMLAAAIIILVAVLGRRPIGRIAGLTFLIAYGFYIAYLFNSGMTEVAMG